MSGPPRMPGPGDRLGGYVLVRLLGRGGMGAVFLGRSDAGLERAVKVASFAGADGLELEARFEREALALARVPPHPNLARIHAAGRAPGVGFYVLDLIEGQPLATLLERGPLPVARALAIAAAVARALDHVHAHRILHRDVKPANVLLRADDGAPVLIDFGLALDLAERERLTLSGAVVGTPSFLAPEQAEGRTACDARTDVYGVGALLYACLAGRPPYPPGNPIEVLGKVLRSSPEPLAEIRPELAPEILALVERAMARSPTGRPATAADLAEELEAVARGETPAAIARARRAVLAKGVLGVVLAAAVGGGFVAWARAFVAARALARAEDERAAAAKRDWVARRDAALASLAALRERLRPAWLGLPIASPDDAREPDRLAGRLEALAHETTVASEAVVVRAAQDRDLPALHVAAALARSDLVAARSALALVPAGTRDRLVLEGQLLLAEGVLEGVGAQVEKLALLGGDDVARLDRVALVGALTALRDRVPDAGLRRDVAALATHVGASALVSALAARAIERATTRSPEALEPALAWAELAARWGDPGLLGGLVAACQGPVVRALAPGPRRRRTSELVGAVLAAPAMTEGPLEPCAELFASVLGATAGEADPRLVLVGARALELLLLHAPRRVPPEERSALFSNLKVWLPTRALGPGDEELVCSLGLAEIRAGFTRSFELRTDPHWRDREDARDVLRARIRWLEDHAPADWTAALGLADLLMWGQDVGRAMGTDEIPRAVRWSRRVLDDPGAHGVGKSEACWTLGRALRAQGALGEAARAFELAVASGFSAPEKAVEAVALAVVPTEPHRALVVTDLALALGLDRWDRTVAKPDRLGEGRHPGHPLEGHVGSNDHDGTLYVAAVVRALAGDRVGARLAVGLMDPEKSRRRLLTEAFVTLLDEDPRCVAALARASQVVEEDRREVSRTLQYVGDHCHRAGRPREGAVLLERARALREGR